MNKKDNKLIELKQTDQINVDRLNTLTDSFSQFKKKHELLFLELEKILKDHRNEIK